MKVRVMPRLRSQVALNLVVPRLRAAQISPEFCTKGPLLRGHLGGRIAEVGYPFDCHLASAQVPDQHRWLPGVGRRVREWQ